MTTLPATVMGAFPPLPEQQVIEPGDRGRVDALGNLEIAVRALGA